MSETLVCRSCGQIAPADARYCSRCGAALVAPGARSSWGVDRLLGKVARPSTGVLGLVLLASISIFAAHLIVTGFSFQWSLVLLALGLGAGCGYLGWEWKTSLSADRRIMRMLVIFAGIGVVLIVVWLIDWASLSLLSTGGDGVVYAIPGVYVEASTEARRLVILDAPPYWLLVMVYGVVAATIGSLIHMARGWLAK